MSIGSRIKSAREAKRMTQEELGAACGTTKQTIFKYETGVITNIPLDRLEKIADVLDIPPASLMGWDDTSSVLPSNVTPLRPMGKVPLVGQIACGTPILAEQNITDYVDLPGHIRADYVLTCRGDSMIGAGIRDGDIVYIRQQEEVENGQIAAVSVDQDEATLKRFYLEQGVVQLVAENPAVPPLFFIGADVTRVQVLGLAVAYTHTIT